MAEQNNSVQTAEEQKKVYSRQQERRELDNYRQTKIERIDRLRYRAYGANGATLDFGVGEGLLTPVELLLAAIAGCSSVDVDAGTSRRSTPEVFEVLASALKQTETVRFASTTLRWTLTCASPRMSRAPRPRRWWTA